MPGWLLTAVLLLAIVGVVSGFAKRAGWLAPVLLVLVGIGLSYVPYVPSFELDPELFLAGVLPLLLYAAAVDTPVTALERNARPIGYLAIGHVLFIAGLVGVVLHAVVPSIPLAAAVALGAIVAPPDAVAATAIAKRLGLPRRIVTILEGESLVNDAAALVLMRVAIAAALGAAVTWGEILWQFFFAAAGGLVIGAVLGLVAAWLHRRTDHPVIDNTISLLTPFAAFAPAEQIGASGVVSVVVCGLIIGNRRPYLMSPASRLQMDAFWRVVRFLLEGVVFLLLGWQIRDIVDGVSNLMTEVVLATGAVVLTVIVGRFLWVFAGQWVFGPLRRADPAQRRENAKASLVISWAGIRGAVSLAAATALPFDFPARDLLIFIAFAVIIVSLVGQGSTLPFVVRRARLRPDDPTPAALAEAQARQAAYRAAIDRLEQITDDDTDPDTLRRLRALAESQANRAWERLGDQSIEPPSETFRRLRTEMLEAERIALLEARRRRRLPAYVARRVELELDLEELLLGEQEQDRVGPSVRKKPTGRDACDHLTDAAADIEARTSAGCEECLEIGSSWVHLRLCMQCGHVGCCDSSPHKHASAHFHQTAHPVMRSFEAEETWRWCFVDEVLG